MADVDSSSRRDAPLHRRRQIDSTVSPLVVLTGSSRSRDVESADDVPVDVVVVSPPSDDVMTADSPTGSDADSRQDGETELPFPEYVETAFYRLHQTNRLRHCCLRLITWPYPCASLLGYFYGFKSVKISSQLLANILLVN